MVMFKFPVKPVILIFFTDFDSYCKIFFYLAMWVSNLIEIAIRVSIFDWNCDKSYSVLIGIAIRVIVFLIGIAIRVIVF